jgi:hypothetical protein
MHPILPLVVEDPVTMGLLSMKAKLQAVRRA